MPGKSTHIMLPIELLKKSIVKNKLLKIMILLLKKYLEVRNFARKLANHKMKENKIKE